MSMTLGTYRISCTEGCLDRLRLMPGSATHVARMHIEETGHACIVTPLEDDGWTLVDGGTSADAAKFVAAGDDRDEVESAGRSSELATSER